MYLRQWQNTKNATVDSVACDAVFFYFLESAANFTSLLAAGASCFCALSGMEALPKRGSGVRLVTYESASQLRKNKELNVTKIDDFIR